MSCRTSGKGFVMFRRVDALGFLAAFMVIAGLVCFLPSNNFLPAWLAYLAGPMLWFFGTIIAVVWMVCRFFPTSAAESSGPTSLSASEQTSADRGNVKRAAL
jgi:fatty acid desaturase